MPIWLAVLAVAALIFYTDDYVVAGVLPEIAADLGQTVGTTGQLITVFSLVVAVVAPVAAVVTAPRRPRAVLLLASGTFVAANVAAALAPSFGVLMGARVVAAVAAAAATPTLFALAARWAPPEQVGRYVAVVALGVTGSIAFGVPGGTWIGGAVGWRGTFLTMAVAGAVVLVAVLTALPGGPGSPALSLRAQLRTLGAPSVSVGLVANVVLMCGSMMLLSYLAPFVAGLADAGVAQRGLLFAVSGVAGMAGIWAGGRATDRWGPDRTLLVGVGTFVGAMVLFAALWTVRPVPVAVLYPLVALWGAAAFWNAPAVQARLHRLAGDASTQALALNTSGTYLGVAAGGFLGGVLLDVAGAGVLPVVSGVAGAGALLAFALAARAASAERERRTSPAPG